VLTDEELLAAIRSVKEEIRQHVRYLGDCRISGVSLLGPLPVRLSALQGELRNLREMRQWRRGSLQNDLPHPFPHSESESE